MNSACKLLAKCNIKEAQPSFPLLRCSRFLLVLLAASLTRAYAAPPAPSGQTAAEIRSVLQAQQEAWNRGDIDAFMNGYARSDSIVLISDDTVTRGWQSALQRYKIKYRSRAKMGKLRFSDLNIEPLGDNAALVFGGWALKRATGIVQGHFTLVFQRLPEGWRIVHDHTSTAGGAQ